MTGILQELNFDPKFGNVMKIFYQNTDEKFEAFQSDFWFELKPSQNKKGRKIF